jgi:hypothetical protein
MGNKSLSIISKRITLRVPSEIIYRGLKDTRLEKLFPEFFVGVTRRNIDDKVNRELTFLTTTQNGQIQIVEKFKLKISGESCTSVEYITKTNLKENDIVIQSILQTHIVNILYSLLMLETGYINGSMKKKENNHNY